MRDHPPGPIAVPPDARADRWSARISKARGALGLTGSGDAERLLTRFRILAAIAGLLIVGLSTLGTSWLCRKEAIRAAEENAVSVARAIYANERDRLTVRDSQGNEALHVPADRVPEVDRSVRNYLEPFRIHNIRMFSNDQVTIYSTDHELIGLRDPGNETLDRVLRERRVDSTATQQNQMTGPGGALAESRQIVDTYLPIISADRVLGAFEVHLDITASSQEISRALAYAAIVMLILVALAMFALDLPMRRATAALLAAQTRLEQVSSTDPLTGVLNRRALIENTQRELSDVRRQGATRMPGFGLIMLDIDRFKQINDEHGHEAGDAVLQAVARNLEAAIRKGDMIARYGGEEFLLLLRSSTRPEAIALAERLRAAISATLIELPNGRQVAVTASFGVAGLDVPDQGFDDAVRAADEALLSAKRAGRNRVRAA